MNSTTTLADPKAFARLRELVKDIDFAMLTTVSNDGSLHSRPMGTREIAEDGDLWFFTADDSAKAGEIGREQHVNVSYAEPRKQAYVSVSGVATIVHDREKARQLWHPLLKAWFPQGLDDPRLALLRVRIESADYWHSPSSKMVQLFGYAKAIATGETPKNLGEHRHLDAPDFRRGR